METRDVVGSQESEEKGERKLDRSSHKPDREKKERAMRVRAASVGTGRHHSTSKSDSQLLDTPRRNPTALPLAVHRSEPMVLQFYGAEESPKSGSAKTEASTSSEPKTDVSASSEPSLSPVTEDRKRKLSTSSQRNPSPRNSSPRSPSPRNIFYSSRGSVSSVAAGSTSSSPRTPSGSPRLIRSHGGSLFTVLGTTTPRETSILPIARVEAKSLARAAEIRFATVTKTSEKQSAEEASQAETCKKHGYAFTSKPKTEEGFIKDSIVLVTGHFVYGSGSRVFLLDLNEKIGEGSKGRICIAYDLVEEKKYALKIFNKDSADEAPFFEEINNLYILGRCGGYYRGNFGDPQGEEKFAILMDYEEGLPILSIMYETKKEIDIGTPEHYGAKKQLTFDRRFKLAKAATKALQAFHKADMVHRDISARNLLVKELKHDYSAVLIDVDASINLSCELVVLDKEPRKADLFSLPIRSNAAYIRYSIESEIVTGDKKERTKVKEHRLYYINKVRRVCERIEIGGYEVEHFDEVLKPTTPTATPRILTKSELAKITEITMHSHQHNPPKRRELNVAFGYAPPELSKFYEPGEQKAYSSFASDIYQLTVLLLDIFTGVNFQYKLHEHYEAVNKGKAFREELKIDDLKKMIDDIFLKEVGREDLAYDNKCDSFESFIFKKLILPELRSYFDLLLSEDPALRPSVDDVLTKLEQLHDFYLKVYTAISDFILEATELSKQGVHYDDILPLIANFSMEDLARLVHEQLSPLTPRKDESHSLYEIRKAREQQEKQLGITKAIEKLVKARDNLNEINLPRKMLQSIILGLCPREGSQINLFLENLLATSSSKGRVWLPYK